MFDVSGELHAAPLFLDPSTGQPVGGEERDRHDGDDRGTERQSLRFRDVIASGRQRRAPLAFDPHRVSASSSYGFTSWRKRCRIFRRRRSSLGLQSSPPAHDSLEWR
jgi:hypothetical protein